MRTSRRFYKNSKIQEKRFEDYSMSPIESLPSEIIHQILDSLEIPALLHLARTCKPLNAFAESHIWSSINLLHPRNAPHGTDPSDEANVDWSIRRLNTILPGLPQRATFVKTLKFQVIMDNWEQIARLLKLTCGSVTDLRIVSSPFRQLWSFSERINAVNSLVSTLQHDQITFPQIRTLRLPLEHRYETLFVLLLKSSPLLDYLVIDRPLQTQWFPDLLPPLPKLALLTRFKIEVVESSRTF